MGKNNFPRLNTSSYNLFITEGIMLYAIYAILMHGNNTFNIIRANKEKNDHFVKKRLDLLTLKLQVHKIAR